MSDHSANNTHPIPCIVWPVAFMTTVWDLEKRQRATAALPKDADGRSEHYRDVSRLARDLLEAEVKRTGKYAPPYFFNLSLADGKPAFTVVANPAKEWAPFLAKADFKQDFDRWVRAKGDPLKHELLKIYKDDGYKTAWTLAMYGMLERISPDSATVYIQCKLMPSRMQKRQEAQPKPPA